MNAGRAMRAVSVSAMVMAAIGALSRAPYTPPQAEGARLRLSWRERGANAEVCRERTADELEALPLHMRTPRVCERHPVAYLLAAHIDGYAALTRELMAAGEKGDRPLYVFEELPLFAGRHRLKIEFQRIGEKAQSLQLDTIVNVARGEILLITLDHGTRRLVIHGRLSDR